MAPPNPKHRSRPRPAPAAAPRRRPTLELPFSDDEVLHADDPRPQHVPVYPSDARRTSRRQEEVIATTVYDISQDEELAAPPWDKGEHSDDYKPVFLYVEKGPGQGQLVPVKQGSMVVGRASVSELRLQHPSVSRRHAQLTRLGERFYLKDLGSQNATFVNKVRIEAEVEVYPGDVLQIGNATIKLRGPAEKVADATRKQLARAEAKSAKRTARKSASGTQTTHLPRRSGALLAVACVGIGVGVSALALLAFKVLDGQAGDGVAIVEVQTSAPVVGMVAPGQTTGPADDRVSERIAREMEKAKPEPVRAEPVAAAPVVVAAPRPAPVQQNRSAVTVARRESPRAAPAPAPAASAASSAPNNAAILKLYEDGNVAAAISGAKAAGDHELAQKLTDFQSAYAAGARAEKAGDAGGAVGAYTKALQVDEKISGGWGKHGPAISKKLGNIFTLYGQHLLKQDEEAAAQKAFGEALKHDPTNAVAKKHLANLSSGGGAAVSAKPAAAPAKAAPARQARAAAIDDAWGDDESPKATREKRRNAIDDAWGD